MVRHDFIEVQIQIVGTRTARAWHIIIIIRNARNIWKNCIVSRYFRLFRKTKEEPLQRISFSRRNFELAKKTT